LYFAGSHGGEYRGCSKNGDKSSAFKTGLIEFAKQGKRVHYATEKRVPALVSLVVGKGFGLFLILGVLIVIMIGGALYLDRRMVIIENQLDFVPPRSYQPPDLNAYEAGNIALDKLSKRQFVYVPSYSHIYYHGGSPFQLETTLSIRNIDLDQPVYLKSIEYFDTEGKQVKAFLDRVIKLAPMQTIEFLVKESDSSGGSGANFLVEWMAESVVDKP